MSSEVIEVEATPIDTDVRRVGEFGAWVAGAQARADAALERYQPAPIADEAGYGRAKKERTAIRKVRGEIDAERKLRLREVEDALKALKEQVKEVTGPLDEADREYKRLMDEWDEAKRQERAATLAREYEDMAPALADMLPYGRMAALCDPEGRWLLRTVSDAKALELMQQAAQRVVADYETIGALPLDEDAKVEVRAEFFRSLDLGAAMRRADEIRAERERIAQFEAERRAAEEAARAAAERAERERAAEAARAAQEAAAAHPAPDAHDAQERAADAPSAPAADPADNIDAPQLELNQRPAAPGPGRPLGAMTAEEYAALPDEIRGFSMPAPRPLAVDMATQPPAGEKVPEVAVIAYVSPAKKAALVAWCKENGIRGRAIATHGRALVIRRWDD